MPAQGVFFPDTGKVKVKRLQLPANDPLQSREREYLSQLADKAGGGEIEIFAVPK